MVGYLNLSSLVYDLGRVSFSNSKRILPLTNNMVIVTEDINYRSNFSYYIINKILQYTKPFDNYIEIGPGYGELSFQVSTKLNESGKVYLFESNSSVYNSLKLGSFLNGLENIYIENREIFNQENISANVIRLNNGASLCESINNISYIIQNSPEIRLFINWQRSLLNTKESVVSIERCLSKLKRNGLVFFDAMQDLDVCNYRIHKLSLTDISKSTNIEFIATREEYFEDFIEEFTEKEKREECFILVWNKALFSAAKNGELKNVIKYIDKGADINHVDTAGATSLYISAQNGHSGVVKALLQAHANVEIKSIHGLSPLYVAVVNQRFEIAELLLEAGASTESSIPGGYTALCVAAHYGYKDLINLLLKHGAKTKPDLIDKNVIQIAKENGHNEVEQYILEYNNNKQEFINDSLFVAAQTADLIKAKELIVAGAEINAISKFGAAALFIAAQNGHLQILELLLQNAAETETIWEGKTPLFMAVQNNHIDIVKALLHAGASTESNNGVPPLYLAVTQKSTEIVEILLKYHASTEVKIGEYTPLSLSVYNGDTENVRLLLNHKASLGVKIEGFNLLYIAAKRGFAEIVGLLIKSGIDLQEAQINGKTPLDIAAENGHVDIVKLLLHEGANIGKSQQIIFKLLYQDTTDYIEVSEKDLLIHKLLKTVSCLESQNLHNENYLEICGINSISFTESDHV